MKEFIWSFAVAYNRVRYTLEVRATLLLLFLVVVTAWLVFSLEPVFTTVSHTVGFLIALLPFLDWPADAEWPTWVDWLDFVVPLALFVGLLMWIRERYVYGAREFVAVERMVPAPRKALIVMLSQFYAIAPNRLAIRAIPGNPAPSATDIAPLLDKARVPKTPGSLKDLLTSTAPGAWQHLRFQVFATSWGTFAAAVVHHRASLEYCWIVSSGGKGGTKELAPLAARLIEVIAGKEVKCFYPVIPNGYEVAPTVEKIDEIYTKELPVHNLPVHEVIADFTGGTAAMSAGMILATLAPERAIEYLRQDAYLFFTDGEALYPVAPEMLNEQEGLVEVVTKPGLVPHDASADSAGA